MKYQLKCNIHDFVTKISQHSNLVDSRGHVSTGAPQASGLQGADSYNLSSLSVTAAKIDCQRSGSSLLSELTRPFCNMMEQIRILKHLLCTHNRETGSNQTQQKANNSACQYSCAATVHFLSTPRNKFFSHFLQTQDYMTN